MNERQGQEAACRKYGVIDMPAPRELTLGISRNVRTGILPLNGLRHPPAGDTTGWYIWAGGEPSLAADFFVPLHVRHLETWCPDAVHLLGLPPGWRFLVDGEREDVWEDRALLDV